MDTLDSLVVDWRDNAEVPEINTEKFSFPLSNPGFLNIFSDPSVPERVKIALAVNFTDEELTALYYAVTEERDTWNRPYFIGIGFTGPGGKFTRHAAPHKADAIRIVEEELVKELEETGLINLERWNEAASLDH